MTTLKLKTKVNFPATVTATGGLKITKTNGIWTIGPDWSGLTLETSLPATQEIWSHDPVADVYYRISVQAFISSLPVGPTGPTGATGATGAAAGLKYSWLTSVTNADPGSGNIKGNNATIASITNLYISETDGSSNALAAVIATWDDSTSTVKSTIRIYDPTNESNFAIFSVTGAITDNGSWDTIPVTYVASGGTLTNALAVRVNTTLAGNAGTNGAVSINGTPSVNQFGVWFDATTVKGVSITGLVKGNGASAPTAAVAGTDYQAADAQLFSNIPQNSKSAAYTSVLTDGEKHIFHPSADTTARIFTIDSNANVAYPIGTTITFVNQASAGTLTIAITSDTMRLAGAGTTGSRTLVANGIATALKVATTEWLISGTGLT